MQTVGPETSFKPGLGLWKLLAVLWKLQQNRHFARRQASRQASLEAGLLEAMEIAIGCYGNCSKGEDLARMRQASRQAMEIAIDAMESALG